MNYNTKYYWKITVWDSNGIPTGGPIWEFTTKRSSGNGGHTTPNTSPVANASESETSGFVAMYITFDGSLSYDPDDDGYITSWLWYFNDGETGSGKTVQHLFFDAGTYDVTLAVTDDQGAADIDTIQVTIVTGNNPPEKPEITGPTSGNKSIDYDYTTSSTDEDNDTISYIFNWGDGETTTTDYMSVGTNVTQSHAWNAAGVYTIEVQATDSQTYSRTAELIVMIDAMSVDTIGYFTDDDGDGTYDIFHGDIATTALGQDDDGNYLIDADGDGEWDYLYNLETGLEVYEEKEDKKTPGFELILVLGAIMFPLFCLRYFRKKNI